MQNNFDTLHKLRSIIRKDIGIGNEIQSNSFNVLFDGIIEMLRCSSDLDFQYTPHAISDFAAKILSSNTYDSVAVFSFTIDDDKIIGQRWS